MTLYKQTPPSGRTFLLFGLTPAIILAFLLFPTFSFAIDTSFSDSSIIFNGMTMQPINPITPPSGSLKLGQISQGDTVAATSKEFDNILPDTAFIYNSTKTGFKENIIINSKPGYTEISYQMDSSQNYSFNPDYQTLNVFPGQYTIGVFERPFFILNGQKVYLNVTWDSENFIYTIDLTALQDLPDDAFPLVIDPTYDQWNSAVDYTKWYYFFIQSGSSLGETNSYLLLSSPTTNAFWGEWAAVQTQNNFTDHPFYMNISIRQDAPACDNNNGYSDLYLGSQLIRHTSTIETLSIGIDAANYSAVNVSILGVNTYYNLGTANKFIKTIATSGLSSGGPGTACVAHNYIYFINYTYYPNTTNAYFVRQPSSDTINAYCQATEYGGYNLNYSYSLYKDGALNFTGNVTGQSGYVQLMKSVTNSKVLSGSNWTLQCNATSLDFTTGRFLTSNTINTSSFLTFNPQIDNCSTFNIPALNLSYFNYLNVSTQVNLTAIFQYNVNGTNTSYYLNHPNSTSDQFCIWPSTNTFYGQSTFQYTDNTGTNYYYVNSQNLNATVQYIRLYTQTGTSQLTLTVLDALTNKVVTNVLVTQYGFINGNTAILEQKYTGIDGKVIFNYIATNPYQFTFSAQGYSTTYWFPSFIPSSTYNILVNPFSIINSSSPNNRVYQFINPSVYYNGTQNVNVSFISQFGDYTSYSVNISYPGGSQLLSGSNPTGEILGTSINVASPNYFDQVYFTITYNTPLTGTVIKTYPYSIIVNSSFALMTQQANTDPTYGMGLFERILIVTGICILALVISMLASQEIPGMFFAFAIQGYWVFVNFIPIWAVIPGYVIGIIIMSSRSA